MSLAFQRALDLWPPESAVLRAFQNQVWWRGGVDVVATHYVGDDTWDVTVRYGTQEYLVVYDPAERVLVIEPWG